MDDSTRPTTKRFWKRILIAAAAVVATVLVTLVVLNLSIGNKPIDQRVGPIYPVSSPEFRWVMSSVLTPSLVEGNRVEPLVNGTEIFPAMLAAIRSARETITLETYIFWSGSIGQEFTEALRERARRGVRIKVLLDWLGSQVNDDLWEEMETSGIEIRRYNEPAWYTLEQMNNRTHRRLLVVDGRIGFIGGAGIADKWTGDAQDPEHWRDTHFRVEGPVVTQLQSAFIDNWIAATGEVLHSIDYLPRVEAVGGSPAHVFKSSPGGGSKSMQLMYLMSIAAATKSIDLSAAYFVPDEVAVRELVAALKRGVRVRIVMPGPHMDMAVVRRASRAKWGSLLEAGAELYEYQPTMYHVKAMVVDGLWVSVGSTNFDSRSFSINDEANLNVYDAALARRQTGIFENDLAHSRRVTLDEWRGRSWWTRSLDIAATLLDSQL